MTNMILLSTLLLICWIYKLILIWKQFNSIFKLENNLSRCDESISETICWIIYYRWYKIISTYIDNSRNICFMYIYINTICLKYIYRQCHDFHVETEISDRDSLPYVLWTVANTWIERRRSRACLHLIQMPHLWGMIQLRENSTVMSHISW